MTDRAELNSLLDRLPEDRLRQVIDYTRSLVSAGLPQGTPGVSLRRFIGTIPPDDLEAMSRAIEEGCETVEHDEW